MTSLTDYAGWLYSQPGLQELLLGLQDEAGQDVLLLLTACWLGRRQVEADAGLWQRLHDSQTPWRKTVVEPLRQARRSLSGSAATAALYEQVKACELAAEFHQLGRLEQLCALASSTADEPRVCTWAHLVRCCGELQDARLRQLADAAAWIPGFRRG